MRQSRVPARTDAPALQGGSGLSRFASSLAQFAPVVLTGAALALVALVYSPSLHVFFHGDDFVALVDVVTQDPVSHFEQSLTFQDRNFYWRPLGDTYYHLIYEAAGLDAFWFHAANLAVFLLTLLLVYRVTTALGLSRETAVVAVLLFGLFPNHVVSVAWITNGSRLVATLLFLGALLATHRAVQARDVRFDAVALVLFSLACLTDEVTIALAPVVILMSPMLQWRGESIRRQAVRLLAYAAFAAVLIPPQVMFTPDDEPRLALYHISPDIPEQAWALVSQLVMPLAPSNPMDVDFKEIPQAQWVAGAIAVALAVPAFVFGSRRVRFLILWTAVGLAPFALWDIDYVAPRYVYFSAIPFAILVAHLGVELVRRAGRRQVFVVAPALAALLVVACGWGAMVTLERNEDFEAFTIRYELLAERLPPVAPDMPPGARVLLMNGIWSGFPAWPEAVLRAVYDDPSLTVTNVPQEHTSSVQTRPGDVLIYYSNGSFTTEPQSSLP